MSAQICFESPNVTRESTIEHADTKDTTGIRGVTRHEDGGFIVRTTINKERVYLGYCKTLDEAAALIAPYRKKKG